MFKFHSKISKEIIPAALNDPFHIEPPEIAILAALEFQRHISTEYEKVNYDFLNNKGKMLGVLVVLLNDKSYAYIAGTSGVIPTNLPQDLFVPSVFDDSVDDYFINKGMKQLQRISDQIKKSEDPRSIVLLKAKRKAMSKALQDQLFKHYNFTNLSGDSKNIVDIFLNALYGTPPSATGECAAPKLLQFAYKQKLKPIAITEFWWGKSSMNNERMHGSFYPACENKCRPLLHYMLNK